MLCEASQVFVDEKLAEAWNNVQKSAQELCLSLRNHGFDRGATQVQVSLNLTVNGGYYGITKATREAEFASGPR